MRGRVTGCVPRSGFGALTGVNSSLTEQDFALLLHDHLALRDAARALTSELAARECEIVFVEFAGVGAGIGRQRRVTGLLQHALSMLRQEQFALGHYSAVWRVARWVRGFSIRWRVVSVVVLVCRFDARKQHRLGQGLTGIADAVCL